MARTALRQKPKFVYADLKVVDINDRNLRAIRDLAPRHICSELRHAKRAADASGTARLRAESGARLGPARRFLLRRRPPIQLQPLIVR